MRYQGITSILASINIKCKEQVFDVAEENQNVSAVVTMLSQRGSSFEVLIPNAVRSIEDMKAIAFETVTGLKYVSHLENFEVTLKNLEFKGDEEFIMCMPVAESEADIPKRQSQRADEEEAKQSN